MSAPPLRRGRLRWRYRGAHRRWWSHWRGNGAGHEHKDHQTTSHERQSKHPHHKPDAAVSPRWRAGQLRRIPARRTALAGIGPAVEARTGDGSRRVRSTLGIRANAKAAKADGSSYAGLGQVQPERSKFDAPTKSPCHTPPSVLPRATQAGERLGLANPSENAKAPRYLQRGFAWPVKGDARNLKIS
jgi:hypothetical protein